MYNIKSQTAYREELIIELYLSLPLNVNEFNGSFLKYLDYIEIRELKTWIYWDKEVGIEWLQRCISYL